MGAYACHKQPLPWFIPGDGREAIPFVDPRGANVNEDRILAKLDSIEDQNRIALIAITRLEEQVRTVPDHETRLRSLERWKWGFTGVLGLMTTAFTAYSKSKGA